MIFRQHPYRSFITLAGLLIFGILAAGSTECGNDSSYNYVPQPTPRPEESGKLDALEWARANSPQLKALVNEIRSGRITTRQEIQKLETLRAQFPDHSDTISETQTQWTRVDSRLDGVMADLDSRVSKAFVESQVSSKSDSQLLEDVLQTWAPSAKAALADLQRIREETSQ